MSVCWGSEIVGACCARLARMTAVLALCATTLPALPCVAAPAPSSSDTARLVKRVHVSSEGIVVERGDRAGRVRVDVGAGGSAPTIEIDDSTGRARGVVDLPSVHIESDEGDRVRMFADIDVDADETVEGDVVALFGSVDVRGRVSGTVVAVLGSVRMHPGAVIDGDAVAVGGVLDQPQGATVTGESVSVGFLNSLPGIPTIATLLALVLAGWVLSLIGGWFLWLIAPQRMLRVAVTASRKTGWSLLLGILLAPLAVIAGVLLSITVIGLPIAFLLPIFCIFVVWAGQVAATYLVGCRLMHRPLGGDNPIVPLFFGSLVVTVLLAAGVLLAGPEGLVRSLALFPLLLGCLVATAMGTIGSGAVLYSMFGSRPIGGEEGAAAPVPGGGSVSPGAAPATTAAPPIV